MDIKQGIVVQPINIRDVAGAIGDLRVVLRKYESKLKVIVSGQESANLTCIVSFGGGILVGISAVSGEWNDAEVSSIWHF